MENTENKQLNTKMIVGVLVALAVVGGLSYKVFVPKAENTELAKTTVTDTNVAVVNGVEISKATFDSQLASVVATTKSQGGDVTSPDKLLALKNQVLDGLISTELVAQGVKASGIKVTPEQVEAQYKAVLTQVGGADKLKEQMTASNITDEQLRTNIANQLAVQAYLLQNIDSKSVTVTDAEINDFYTNFKKTQTNAPALKDLKEQIKQQITLNKQQALVNTFIAGLKQKAKIETKL
jgi:hypothetical protein